jgi:hypothetical protein
MRGCLRGVIGPGGAGEGRLLPGRDDPQSRLATHGLGSGPAQGGIRASRTVHAHYDMSDGKHCGPQDHRQLFLDRLAWCAIQSQVLSLTFRGR